MPRRRLPASGIAWSDDLIVCAHHAVEFEDDISIGTAEGERLRATLIGRDPRIDLALLRVDAPLKPAEWAPHADLRTGNLVIALGRPRQNIRASLGIVAGLGWRRRREAPDQADQSPILGQYERRQETMEATQMAPAAGLGRRRLGARPRWRPYPYRPHHVPRFFRRSPGRRRWQGLRHEYLRIPRRC